MDLMDIRREMMGVIAQMGKGCPLNITEITIAPGEYTIAEFWGACQSAVGAGIYKWLVLADENSTFFLMANGSKEPSSANVLFVNDSLVYGGIQRAASDSGATWKRAITSDMKFYLYKWD